MIKINELTHYGVLGMKWGVRRYQPYPKGKHGTFLGQSRDDDILIKKGNTAFRVQSTPNLQGKGHSYISFDPNDHLEYLTCTASGEGGVSMDLTLENGNEGRPYSLKLKLANDVVAPSYQKSMDAFIRTVDNMGGAKKAAEDIFTGPTKMYKKKEIKEFVKNFNHLSVDEMRDAAYIRFTGTLMRDTVARNMFFSDLKSQGYNAVVDEWDAKFGNGFTKAPVIVFDKSTSLKTEKSKPMSKTDFEYFNERMWGDAESAKRRYKKNDTDWQKWINS